jgi:hypothetical protein
MGALMRHRLRLMLLAAAIGAACSDQTLTSDRVATLIGDLDAFKREAFLTIRTGVPFQSAFECQSQTDVASVPSNRFVVDRGWVRYETREGSFGFGARARCPAMALTAAGQAASAQWTQRRIGSGEGVAWGIPIGRREIVTVREPTTGPEGSSQVEFEWKWTPSQTGLALQESVPSAQAWFDQPRQGRASCRSLDDGWRCQMAMWRTPADAGEFQP